MALRSMRGTNRHKGRPARDAGTGPRLRLVVGGAKRSPEPHVLAEVLSDGTIRHVDGTGAWDTGSPSGWRQGSVSGDGWTLWWERRPWADQAA